jgi:hypothetical protein
MAATAAPRKRRAPAKPTAGQRLLAELSAPGDDYSLQLLVQRAAHTADWLEKLDALLAGEKSAWATVRIGRDDVAELRVDNALSEARQQTTVLRHLLGAIHQRRSGVPMGNDPDDDLADL